MCNSSAKCMRQVRVVSSQHAVVTCLFKTPHMIYAHVHSTLLALCACMLKLTSSCHSAGCCSIVHKAMPLAAQEVILCEHVRPHSIHIMPLQRTTSLSNWPQKLRTKTPTQGTGYVDASNTFEHL